MNATPELTTLRVAVGTKNNAKLDAVKKALHLAYPKHAIEIKGFDVPSGVSAQPMSTEETQRGAINRAKLALKKWDEAEFGVGLEGGLEVVGEKWFECGWIAAVNKVGKIGMGSSARFEMAKHIVDEIKRTGAELAEIIDRLSGKSDVRSSLGMMGVITNGTLPRSDCYSHGVLFAFAPFVSGPQYWD